MKKKNENQVLKLLSVYSQEILNTPGKLKNCLDSIIQAVDKEGLEQFSKLTSLQKLLRHEEIFTLISPLVHNDNNLNFIKLFFDLSSFTFNSEVGFHILNEAASNGSVQIVKFLLDKNTPISYSKHPANSFHYAAQSNNKNVLELLLQKSKSVKTLILTRDSFDFNPLEIANILEHNETKITIVRSLLKNRIKYPIDQKVLLNHPAAINYKNVILLEKQAKKNQLNNINKEMSFYKGKVNLFKAMFYTNNKNEHYISEAISIFLKTLNSTQDGKINNSCIEFLSIISYFLDNINDRRLKKEIANIPNKIKNLTHKILLLKELATSYCNDYNYIKGEEYALGAYKTYQKLQPSQLDTKVEYNILTILIATTKHVDSKKTLEYISLAEKLNPYDSNLLSSKIFVYQISRNYKKALFYIEKLLDQDLKDLWKANILIHMKESTAKIEEKTNFFRFFSMDLKHPCYKLFFDTYVEICFQSEEYNEILIEAQRALNFFTNPGEIISIITFILEVYKIQKCLQTGFLFYQEACSKYSEIIKQSSSLDFHYLEYIYLENNKNYQESSEVINYLINKASLGNRAYYLTFEALQMVLINDITDKDLVNATKQLQFFQQLLDNCPGNNAKSVEIVKKLEVLVNLLRTPEKENHSANDDANLILSDECEAKKEFYKNIDLLKLTPEEFEEAKVYLTPRSIHYYFQQKKLALAAHRAKDIDENKEIIYSWRDSHNKVVNSNDENVYYFADKPNSYFYLPEKTFDKLDPIQRKQFKLQISKGLVTKNHSMNGIKEIFMPGTSKLALVEAKINADKRIYAKKAFENFEGKTIYILDKIGNHEDINNAVKTPINIFFSSFENLQNLDEELDIHHNLFDVTNIQETFHEDDHMPLTGDHI